MAVNKIKLITVNKTVLATNHRYRYYVLNKSKKEEAELQKIKLGLIPSPDLPAELTSNFVDDLPDFLSSHVDDSVSWNSDIVIDPLVGSAEYMSLLMDKAIKLKKKNNWDYVICLTDLPHFMEKYIVIADVNTQNKVALISIPAFGAFPMKYRTKRTICNILNDMYDETNTTQVSRREYKKEQKKSHFSLVKRINLHNENEKAKKFRDTDKNEQANEKIPNKSQDHPNKQDKQTSDDKNTDHENNGKDEEKTQEDTEKKSDIRYIIESKFISQLRIISGMTFSNRPWTALVSFKKILMLAFGTGVYITIFPTPWELSTIYSIPRFILLMIVAIIGMVTWIIFAHNLWEKPTKKGDIRLRKLYNYTTITTLLVIVLINYTVLFCLFSAAIGIFVPPGLFEAGTDLKNDPSIKNYFLLTWLVTSLGTLAGSIGTASEDESKIRQITYSYRQINRYYEIEDENDDNKNKGDQGNEDQESMKKSEHSKRNHLIRD